MPFSVDKQTIVFPGFDGGAEWGGSAVDTRTGVIYINANEMAWTGGLTANRAGLGPGETAYNNLCASCHGDRRQDRPRVSIPDRYQQAPHGCADHGSHLRQGTSGASARLST